MTDYISRAEAIRAVEIVDFYKGSGIVPSGYASDAIRAIPAADVAPIVRGRWETATIEETGQFWAIFCTNCNAYLPYGLRWMPPYCPNCVARI